MNEADSIQAYRPGSASPNISSLFSTSPYPPPDAGDTKEAPTVPQFLAVPDKSSILTVPSLKKQGSQVSFLQQDLSPPVKEKSHVIVELCRKATIQTNAL